MKKLMMMFAAAAVAMGALAGDVTATSVTAKQRSPWNGKFDVVVTLVGAAEDVAKAQCSFVATNTATKAALPVTHVTRMGTTDSGSGTTWTRRFVWDAASDLGPGKINDIALTVRGFVPEPPSEPGEGVQLWENGPYWAECNVGASKPEESGYYFWWGDTVGYKREGGTWTDDRYYSGVTWVSSKGATMSSSPFIWSSCPTDNKSTSTLQSQGYIDSTGNLVAKYDAATAHLGAPWRMPTSAEIDALINNCTTSWTTKNGVYGRLVTGKGAYASKSIFLPAAGCGCDSYLDRPGSSGIYWSSTPDSDYSNGAWRFGFASGNFSRVSSDLREYGQSVRPVRGLAK